MQLDFLNPPKIDSYGCYDVDEVLDYAKIVGIKHAAKKLNIPLHRVIHFQSKKEAK